MRGPVAVTAFTTNPLGGSRLRVPHMLVPDAYPWQDLGPGHLQRLGSPPPNSTPLGADRHELSIGDITDWNEPAQRAELISQGRTLLRPCRVGLTEALALSKASRETELS
jgi:hypothetical protein